MALHGDISINGDIIFSWVAVRRNKKIDKDGFYTYDWRGVEFPRGNTRVATWARKGVLTHKYADGAVVLATAVLTAYQAQKQEEVEDDPRGAGSGAGGAVLQAAGGDRAPEEGAAPSVEPQ